MSGFGVWVRKESFEIRRTWRLWVLPLLVITMAILSPVLAWVTPDLVRSFASDEPGVVIELPDPVSADALRQWAQSLTQIILIAIVITTSGIVSSELRSGTATMLLTKPLSRSSFVLAKALVQSLFVGLLAILGAAIAGVVTRVIFGELSWRNLVELTAVWLGLALFMIAVMTMFSTLLASATAAAGIGIAFYFVLTLGSLWRPVRDFSPSGLLSAVDALAVGNSQQVIVPAISAVVLSTLALGTAVIRLNQMSLRGSGASS